MAHGVLSSNRRGVAVGAAVALWSLWILGGCLFPADESGELRVDLLLPENELVVGGTLSLRAVVLDAQSRPIPGADVRFISTDPRVAIVDRGVLRAVSQGSVWVIGLSVDFAAARPDSELVAVVPAAEQRVLGAEPSAVRGGG